MISRFKNDESGYVSWLSNNQLGFVFNHFGGSDPSFNIIHKADCRTLRRTSDEGSRTVVEKICSENLRELEEVASRLRGSAINWSKCKICFPKQ